MLKRLEGPDMATNLYSGWRTGYLKRAAEALESDTKPVKRSKLAHIDKEEIDRGESSRFFALSISSIVFRSGPYSVHNRCEWSQ